MQKHRINIASGEDFPLELQLQLSKEDDSTSDSEVQTESGSAFFPGASAHFDQFYQTSAHHFLS